MIAVYEWLFAPPGSVPPGWDPGRASAALGEAIDSDRAAVLVAEDDERLVGLCTAYLDLNSIRFGSRCWVEFRSWRSWSGSGSASLPSDGLSS